MNFAVNCVEKISDLHLEALKKKDSCGKPLLVEEMNRYCMSCSVCFFQFLSDKMSTVLPASINPETLTK